MQNYYQKTDELNITQPNKINSSKQTSDTRINYAAQSGPTNVSSKGDSTNISRHSLMQLQRDYGNHYVQRVIEVARKAEGEADVTADVEQKINRSRGGGQALDSKASSQIGSALNADFSGVRVHTGSEADSLNRSLSAKAFTTGQDVFFRQGEYNPGSSSGRALLAHELTHVVQQNPGTIQNKPEDDKACSSCVSGINRSIQFKLTVGSPGDVYEQEADQMAQSYTAWEQKGSGTNETTGTVVNRQPIEEEEKQQSMVMGKQADGLISRQPEEEQEEESVQTKLDSGKLQRQEEMEEEETT